jgi:nicotinamide-nucleotide adenylyltransferase
VKRIVVIGRFQPPHRGHLHVLQRAAARCDQLIVVVGSAQESFTLQNPFTAGERIEMLDVALRARGLTNHLLVPLADLNRPAEWVAYLESFVPEFEEVVTNNPLTEMLFRRVGYKVRAETMFEPTVCSGTRVRERLVKGQSVADALDPAVLKVMRRIRAEQRLQKLAGGARAGARKRRA